MIAHHLKHKNRVFYLFLLTSLLLHGSVSTVLFWLAPHTAPHAESPAVIMVSLASPLQQKSNSSPATLSAPVTPSVVPKSNTASPSVATKPASTPVTSTVPVVKHSEIISGKTAPTAVATGTTGSGSTAPLHASTGAQPRPLHAGAGEKTPPAEMTFGSASGPAFIRQSVPVYPSHAKRRGKEGTVLLRLSISESGKLTHVEIIEDPGHGLSEAALEAVRSSSFSPAHHNGKPVAVQATLPIRFKLH
jgi:protein TonB